MATEAQRRYYDRIRGVTKGPDSMNTRAAKAASHRAQKGTRAWALWFDFEIAKLHLERALAERIKEA